MVLFLILFAVVHPMHFYLSVLTMVSLGCLLTLYVAIALADANESDPVPQTNLGHVDIGLILLAMSSLLSGIHIMQPYLNGVTTIQLNLLTTVILYVVGALVLLQAAVGILSVCSAYIGYYVHQLCVKYLQLNATPAPLPVAEPNPGSRKVAKPKTKRNRRKSPSLKSNQTTQTTRVKSRML